VESFGSSTGNRGVGGKFANFNRKNNIITYNKMEDTKKVAFNLSHLMMGELQGLIHLSNKCYLRCDWKGCFHTLRCIKRNVIQSLTKEERKQLKQLEDTTFLMARTQREKNELRKKTEEYNEMLMDVLEAHGFLVKEREDHKKMF